MSGAVSTMDAVTPVSVGERDEPEQEVEMRTTQGRLAIGLATMADPVDHHAAVEDRIHKRPASTCWRGVHPGDGDQPVIPMRFEVDQVFQIFQQLDQSPEFPERKLHGSTLALVVNDVAGMQFGHQHHPTFLPYHSLLSSSTHELGARFRAAPGAFKGWSLTRHGKDATLTPTR